MLAFFDLTVAGPALVRSTLEVRVFEVEGRKTMRPGRDRDDPGSPCAPQRRKQAKGPLEVTEVVRRQVRLVAALVSLKRRGHDACAIDEDVEWALGREKAIWWFRALGPNFRGDGEHQDLHRGAVLVAVGR